MPAYKDTEKKTWYVKFRYKDWTGKPSFTTKRGFRTKNEALAYERNFKENSNAQGTNMTVSDLINIYMKTMKARLRPTTIKQRDTVARLYILPKLGHIPLNKLTKAVIVQWQDWMLSCNSARTGMPLSESRLRINNTNLSTFLNYAVNLEYIPRNPMKGLKPIGRVGKRVDIWTKDEYDKFIAAGKGTKRYETYRLCFDILFYSGMRIGEFLGLNAESFDFEHSMIKIDHAVDDKGRIVPVKTKTSVRSIPMPRSIMDRIKAFSTHLYDAPETNFFLITYTQLRYRLKTWSKKAGLKYILVHGLRHSHASYLINLGVPITAISHRLGHTNAQITLSTYSHLYKEDETSIARLLESKM